MLLHVEWIAYPTAPLPVLLYASGQAYAGSGTWVDIWVDINIYMTMSRQSEVTREITLHVRDHCLCLHAQRAARALARRFDEAFRPLGLTNGQFSLMMTLNRPEPPTMGAIAKFLAMDRTTLTAALKPLERRGLVEVAIDSRDRRARRMKLTPAGRSLLATAVPIWRETHAEIDRMLPKGDPDQLRKALGALS
jgi:DNA-binding MarR family transcriptional regulator